MYKEKKIKVLVLAAGSGKRMETTTAKQYLEILGKPMLYYSLVAFQESFADEIVLVTSAGEEEYCQTEIVEKFQLSKVTQIVSGGEERYHSVAAGLAVVGECDYLLIHDAARPCLRDDVICRAIDGAITFGACTVGVKVTDTISKVDEQRIVEIPNRNVLWSVQTPQCFSYVDIKEAYRRLKESESHLSLDEREKITDDVRIVQQFLNIDVFMVEGGYENLKVTTPNDLKVAEIILIGYTKGILTLPIDKSRGF